MLQICVVNVWVVSLCVSVCAWMCKCAFRHSNKEDNDDSEVEEEEEEATSSGGGEGSVMAGIAAATAADAVCASRAPFLMRMRCMCAAGICRANVPPRR